MSYFRPRKTRETGPRSICSLPDSTQKLSRKRGGVTLQSVPIGPVSIQGFTPVWARRGEGMALSCPANGPESGGGAFQPARGTSSVAIFSFFFRIAAVRPIVSYLPVTPFDGPVAKL